MKVDIVFLLYALCAPLLFRACRPSRAVLAILLGGWVLLPVGHYPYGSAEAVFPYWITGLAVPSEMLLTKAWIAPLAALLGALLFDRPALRSFRPKAIDAPMVGWVLWPLLVAPFAPSADPPAWISSLYLAGVWGLPWLLGRIYFTTSESQRELARGFAWSGLACLPFGLVEGVFGPSFYTAVYETHPFRNDGAERYLGYRPLGFFEDGNQYGLWIALAALVALWLAATETGDRRRVAVARGVAAVVTSMALASQSVGAIVLMLLGCAFLAVGGWIRLRGVVVALAAVVIVAGALYVSGRVPVAQLARDTEIGRQVVDGLRGIGRGSFGWRIAQDQKLLPDAMARPLTGNAEWSWWRAQGIRPWGLSLLVLGQFGLPGMCLCLATLLVPAIRLAMLAPRGSGWAVEALPLMLATVVALTAVDALMNSFIFFPALVAAGAIATAVPKRRRGEITRVGRRAVA